MSRALEFLHVSQNPDGGWGYRQGGISYVEPTAAVLLALQFTDLAPSIMERARGWLRSVQRADGGWGIAPLDDESGWMTGWAVWALAETDRDAAQRGADWLLAAAGLRVTDPAQIEGVERVLHINPAMTGWSWQPGDAAWIFTSALALLALDAVGIREHARTTEALAYLLDRAIPAGGWNIGNPFMVTGNLPPTVENTVMALLALEAYGIETSVTQAAQGWLARDGFTPTAFEWAWRGWYWAHNGRTNEAARAALAALRRQDGSWDGNPFTTAIAIMAGGDD